ncbi:MAG: [FeFe] hydrogenase H-cluster radical SAM maturase HydE [Spirochaetota bacterium]
MNAYFILIKINDPRRRTVYALRKGEKMDALNDILIKDELSRDDMIVLLSLEERDQMNRLFERAYEVKKKYVGTTVYYRGLIEVSNICEKNCNYCGIRRDNRGIERYRMSEEEILGEARQAWEWGYGSIVLQSGETTGENYARFIEDIIRKIKELSSGELGITLSLGEQDEDVYRRWFDAGAHRYLLRIESSRRDLYYSLHPHDHDFDRRIACLETLGRIGYYLGTGVMIGLPGQTAADLADDILFFRTLDADMIGMGPFIPHHGTPMSGSIPDYEAIKYRQLDKALQMIAVTRIALKDVNIASATALQAIDEFGREMGLKAGANIIMPNMTETKYRRDYQLYDNKPCLDENAVMCRGCLDGRISAIGEKVGYRQLGDSPHYKNSHNKKAGG